MSAADTSKLLAAGPWREVPRRLAALWRRSLQFRTVIITLGLSGLAILVIGLYISFSVASNLFQAQRESVLEASNNATAAAQSILDSSAAADRASLQSLMGDAVSTITSISGSSDYAIFRAPGQQANSSAPPDQLSRGLGGVITPELRAQVQENPGGQYWQSVALTNDDGGTDPGIVVGSTLDVPAAGRYEL